MSTEEKDAKIIELAELIRIKGTRMSEFYGHDSAIDLLNEKIKKNPQSESTAVVFDFLPSEKKEIIYTFIQDVIISDKAEKEKRYHNKIQKLKKELGLS